MSNPAFDAHRSQAVGVFPGPFHTIVMAYNGSDLLEYVGWALPGSGGSTALAIWRIAKLAYSGTLLTSVKWAEGDVDFEHIWDNRAALSYS